ncbi:hypothetical protein [Pseudomonas sp. yb_9]|uniref:hypothetical protein n=1 Tax=Pseudomonas sp. yb_9 TaxID=3367222 RepID=UPI00370B4D75
MTAARIGVPGLCVLLLVLVFCAGYHVRGISEKSKAVQVQNEQLAKAFEQGQELGVVRDRIVTEYVDRVQVIRERGETIVKEIPVYVSAKADAACVVPVGFARVHDATAAGLPAPEPARTADEAPSGIALSAVAETTAGNYATCNETAERLIGLQELVREYEKKQAGM